MRRSTGRFYAFCAIVFGLGLAASGYLNYYQYQRGQDHQQLDQDTIAQLKREAVIVPVASPTSSPVAAVLGAKVITVPELGITLTTLNPLGDFSYQYQQLDGLDGINITSTSLINTTTTCGPGALGRLVRQSADAKPALSATTLVKLIGSENYYYQPAKFACAKDPVTTAALKADAAIMPAILTTLSAGS
ncbi:hypothetical protein HJC99_00880 [Candidatus Saccharibacteria bacterium]|nr:hypothetical protein [Candidatus Saccharibacteria bacterium]